MAKSYKETVAEAKNGTLVDEEEAKAEPVIDPASAVVENSNIPRLTPRPPSDFDICRGRVQEINAHRMRDPINTMVGSDLYRQNAVLKGHTDRYGKPLVVSRHYLDIGLAIDMFKATGPRVDEEIRLKTEACENLSLKYIALASGKSLTPELVKAAGIEV